MYLEENSRSGGNKPGSSKPSTPYGTAYQTAKNLLGDDDDDTTEK